MSDASSLWPEVLTRLVGREDLTSAMAEAALGSILAGEASDAKVAAFALGLRAKGESPIELAALVRTMLAFGERVETETGSPLVDTCGTGGDRAGTVNVSTMAALIAAAAGVKVAKHGNRAASSKCGSADVLEALGVVIDLGPAGVRRCIGEVGIGFCFAPRFHPAMRFAAPARRELGVATTFNFLGPLANPAGATRRTVGVSDPAMAERIVAALDELGVERALVFYGHDGLDELTTTASSTVFELLHGSVSKFELHPDELGLTLVDRSSLAGGDAVVNAEAVRRVLSGQPSALRDIAMLNAAAALMVADRVEDLAEGLDVAGGVLDDGRAAATLDTFVRTSVAAREMESD